MIRSAHALFLFALLLPSACSKAAPSPTSAPDVSADDHARVEEGSDHPPLPRRVQLQGSVVESAGIRTQAAKREALATSIDLPGEVIGDPDRTAHLAARIRGRIDRVLFREGEKVEAGKLLVVIRAPELGELRSTYLSASARASAAKANAERLRALKTSRIAAAHELLVAETEAVALEAEARAASEKLAALGIPLPKGKAQASSLLELRAPISGTVIARDAVVGQPVDADRTLATIVDVSEVWFVARAFEHALSRVHQGGRAEVELNAHPGERFVGTIDYIAPRIDPTARTVTARIPLENRDGMLRLGLFGTARVEISGTARAPSLVVPRDAITEIAGRKVVFVRQSDGDFEVHDLELGASMPGKVEVLSGLSEGEEVVVQGVFTLKSAVLRGSLGDDN